MRRLMMPLVNIMAGAVGGKGVVVINRMYHNVK